MNERRKKSKAWGLIRKVIIVVSFIIAAMILPVVKVVFGEPPGPLPGPDSTLIPAGSLPPTDKKDNQGGSFSNPVWSPSGDKIAFIYSQANNQEVYIVNADGSNPVNVSKSNKRDENPVWSPDGNYLAFVTARNGWSDICTVTKSGQNLKCLTEKEKKDGKKGWDDTYPVWSPDGSMIAYCSYRYPRGNAAPEYGETSSQSITPQIWFMNSDGSNPRMFLESIPMKDKDKQERMHNDSCYPNFSANGRSLAFSSAGDLYVVDLRTGGIKNITEGLINGNMVDDTMPVWSPRGNRLAFIGRYEANESELYTISGAGKQVRRITDNLYEDFLPKWSPDGKSLIYSGFVRGRFPELFIADPMSPDKTQVTDNFDVEMDPSFSPDGKMIIYTRRIKGVDELYIKNVDKKNKTQPTKEQKFFPNGFKPPAVTVESANNG